MDDDILLAFHPFDWEKCSPPCNRLQLNEAFLKRLEDAWERYPFVVLSGYRTPRFECAHGRCGRSAYTVGKAADISTPDPRTRFYVFKALFEAGFTRFGFGPSFITVDIDVCSSRPDRSIYFKNGLF